MEYLKKIFNSIKQWLIHKFVREVAEEVSLLFTVEDKDLIAEILRPFVKNMNSEVLYKTLCATMNQSKVLKTYVVLSDDKKEIKISFTQNEKFNEKISPFIEANFLPTIKERIKEAIKNCDVKLDKGTIIITRTK